jgi:hypothetical protein
MVKKLPENATSFYTTRNGINHFPISRDQAKRGYIAEKSTVNIKELLEYYNNELIRDGITPLPLFVIPTIDVPTIASPDADDVPSDTDVDAEPLGTKVDPEPLDAIGKTKLKEVIAVGQVALDYRRESDDKCISEKKLEIDSRIAELLKTIKGYENNAAIMSTLKDWNSNNDPGAQRIWGPRVPILLKAAIYMQGLLNGTPPCLCWHDKLGALTYKYAQDENGELLSKHDTKRFGLKNAFKDLAFLVVPKERRLGGNKKDRTSSDVPEACKCEIPQHKEFTVPRTGK